MAKNDVRTHFLNIFVRESKALTRSRTQIRDHYITGGGNLEERFPAPRIL
jgi:hypothetical protein